MKTLILPLLLLLLVPAAAAHSSDRSGRVVQKVVHSRGFVEPHTPGSGSPEELAVDPRLEALLGAPVNLNRVTTVRTRFEGPNRRPKVVLILIPGFLGGATTFDPLARDLVKKFRGKLEVWAVDRRPNQLEDRLGSLHASAGVKEPRVHGAARPRRAARSSRARSSTSRISTARRRATSRGRAISISTSTASSTSGSRFVDRFGVTRGPIMLRQDDARFMAHWGLDTYFRDWKRLLQEARAAGDTRRCRAARRTLAGHELVHALRGLRLRPRPGAGRRRPFATSTAWCCSRAAAPAPERRAQPTLAQYQATVAALAAPGGPDVFLRSLLGLIPLLPLGQVGEVASLAALHQPNEPALSQRTTDLRLGPGRAPALGAGHEPRRGRLLPRRRLLELRGLPRLAGLQRRRGQRRALARRGRSFYRALAQRRAPHVEGVRRPDAADLPAERRGREPGLRAARQRPALRAERSRRRA